MLSCLLPSIHFAWSSGPLLMLPVQRIFLLPCQDSDPRTASPFTKIQIISRFQGKCFEWSDMNVENISTDSRLSVLENGPKKRSSSHGFVSVRVLNMIWNERQFDHRWAPGKVFSRWSDESIKFTSVGLIQSVVKMIWKEYQVHISSFQNMLRKYLRSISMLSKDYFRSGSFSFSRWVPADLS